jgi:hypothetical protein
LFALLRDPVLGRECGQTVLSYQFYNAAGGTTNFLTPVLLQQLSNPQQFEIMRS